MQKTVLGTQHASCFQGGGVGVHNIWPFDQGLQRSNTVAQNIAKLRQWVSLIERGCKALVCRKTENPFGHLIWRFGSDLRAIFGLHLRFLACISDFRPVTPIFGGKSESCCWISAPNHFSGLPQQRVLESTQTMGNWRAVQSSKVRWKVQVLRFGCWGATNLLRVERKDCMKATALPCAHPRSPSKPVPVPRWDLLCEGFAHAFGEAGATHLDPTRLRFFVFSLSLSISLSICLSQFFSLCLSVCLSCLSVCPVCLSVLSVLSVCPVCPVCLSVCLSGWLAACCLLSVCLSPSISLSVSLYLAILNWYHRRTTCNERSKLINQTPRACVTEHGRKKDL